MSPRKVPLRLLLAAIGALAIAVSPIAFAQAGMPTRRIISGPTLPATCLSSVLIKDVWYKTGSGAGIYVCTAGPGTWTQVTSSSAPMSGPGSSTDNAVARFDGTGGSTLQNSVVLIGDTGNVTGLGTLNTHTLPGGTDTIALLAASQVFTGKSISGATNTLSAIGNASLTNSSITVGSTLVSLGATAATIAGLTLTQPTIADFTNAVHDHLDADDGGTLSTASLTSGQLAQARGGTGLDTSASTGYPSISVGTWSVSQALSSTTLQTSGNVGIGTTPNATTGRLLDLLSSGNQSTIFDITNSDSSGTTTTTVVRATSSAGNIAMRAYGTGNTSAIFGLTLGGYSSLLATGNGLLVGTSGATPLVLGTQSTARINVSSGGDVSLPTLAVTAGTMAGTFEAVTNRARTCRSWTNAQVAALAGTAGDIAWGTLPAKYEVSDVKMIITGAAVGPTTVTVSLGRTSATYIDYIVASDAKAAANTVYGDASAERGTNLTGYDLPSYTGTTVINAHFVSTGANLSTTTGSTGMVCVTLDKLP